MDVWVFLKLFSEGLVEHGRKVKRFKTISTDAGKNLDRLWAGRIQNKIVMKLDCLDTQFETL